MGFSVVAAMVLATSAPFEPLPDHVDIPDGFSTVICPNSAAAKTMLDLYYTVKGPQNAQGLDIPLFFEGLKATGCLQDSVARKGTITITAVQQRKALNTTSGPEVIMRYVGTNAAGVPVIGLVNEGGNEGYSRTPLSEWTSQRTVDGWLDARGHDASMLIFLRCATPEKARATVAATNDMDKAKPSAFAAKLSKVAAQNGCRPARGRYFVTSILTSSGNECGEECFTDLTALSALDRSGLTVGLIYDASLM